MSATRFLNVLLWGDHVLFTHLSTSGRLFSCRGLPRIILSPQGQVETSLSGLPCASLCCHVLLQVGPTAHSSTSSHLFTELPLFCFIQTRLMKQNSNIRMFGPPPKPNKLHSSQKQYLSYEQGDT